MSSIQLIADSYFIWGIIEEDYRCIKVAHVKPGGRIIDNGMLGQISVRTAFKQKLAGTVFEQKPAGTVLEQKPAGTVF